MPVAFRECTPWWEDELLLKACANTIRADTALMSAEVRENTELLTSVPISGRMKNVYVDAAGVASCLQLPIASSQDQNVGSIRAPTSTVLKDLVL